jgi:hypothetical protein
MQTVGKPRTGNECRGVARAGPAQIDSRPGGKRMLLGWHNAHLTARVCWR